ncbi:acyl-CoA thioesterase [Wenzhouxiangella marina]|uniref:Acyl-CoA thioesterase II, putative n=1 Tax=Wenzhouxiangella marina TaxID=1579979 RepID=A0A0K0XYE8_9GAMM|nr:thioesterase family protein [Wenzhouxiangella marina]AKS42703.1 Acyl-CoA thioesterase II, putative [Wenzhouxiangella marina]MBB6088608.1 acyl-CoA thioesterase [Wenzhouxiangella marina]
MSFDEFRVQAAAGQAISVPTSWTQGRTVFGGLSAGLLAEALGQGTDEDRRLRYLEIGFLRPLAPDTPFRIELEAVSAGRTVAVRSARIVQEEQVRVTALANFVRPLEGTVEIETFKAPDFPSWDDPRAVRIHGPGTPAFTRHIDFRGVTAGRPFSGQGLPELGGWMRFDSPPQAISPAHLVCLIDSWPPVPISYYDRPVPMSSINWQIHFGEPLDGVRGDAFLGYLAHCNFFRDGYGSSSAEVWAADGCLLAKSFQTFVVFG